MVEAGVLSEKDEGRGVRKGALCSEGARAGPWEAPPAGGGFQGAQHFTPAAV